MKGGGGFPPPPFAVRGAHAAGWLSSRAFSWLRVLCGVCNSVARTAIAAGFSTRSGSPCFCRERRASSASAWRIYPSPRDEPAGHRQPDWGHPRVSGRCRDRSTTSGRSGSGACWPSSRRPAWSPWPIWGYQGSAHAKIPYRERTSRIPESRQPRSREAARARRAGECPAQDLENSPEAALLPVARRPARQDHPRFAGPRGISRMEKVQCSLLEERIIVENITT